MERKRVKRPSSALAHRARSLHLIDSQRLSAATWNKEVDKLVSWGAVVPDRQMLIDYLVRHYSNMQPPPPSSPTLSVDSK